MGSEEWLGGIVIVWSSGAWLVDGCLLTSFGCGF